MSSFQIKVPASSANIGAGFDSMGMAVNRYLTLNVEASDKWTFNHQSEHLPVIDQYEEQYIYQVAHQIATKYRKTLHPHQVNVTSTIPLARGLGSSAAAVIAGIELANKICELRLTKDDKLQLATEVEGHPDNVAPALLGGLVVSSKTSHEEIHYIKLQELELDIVLYIPNVELKTEEARNVLPTSYERDVATSASGISNIMVAALIDKQYELAGKMMESDLFHEPYRKQLIPNYGFIKKRAKELGAYSTVISGAGPTLISFVPKGEGNNVASQLLKEIPTYDVRAMKIDTDGLTLQ